MSDYRPSGLAVGLALGVVLAIASLVVAFVVSLVSAGEIEARPLEVIAVYVLGGGAGGALFDLLEPLTRRLRFGGGLVGFLVTLPVSAAIGWLMGGAVGGWAAAVFSVLFTALLLGGLLGQLFLGRWQKDESS